VVGLFYVWGMEEQKRYNVRVRWSNGEVSMFPDVITHDLHESVILKGWEGTTELMKRNICYIKCEKL
jgi:hypothetical protein